jgi:hypothetical protein
VLVYESRVLQSVEDLVTAHAVVVDFGNACWTHKHFTDDIQTRQYRCGRGRRDSCEAHSACACSVSLLLVLTLHCATFAACCCVLCIARAPPDAHVVYTQTQILVPPAWTADMHLVVMVCAGAWSGPQVS